MSEPSFDLTIQPQISPPMPSAATSAPVSTPITPGAAAAAVVSTRLIAACAKGERTKQA